MKTIFDIEKSMKRTELIFKFLVFTLVPICLGYAVYLLTNL